MTGVRGLFRFNCLTSVTATLHSCSLEQLAVLLPLLKVQYILVIGLGSDIVEDGSFIALHQNNWS